MKEIVILTPYLVITICIIGIIYLTIDIEKFNKEAKKNGWFKNGKY